MPSDSRLCWCIGVAGLCTGDSVGCHSWWCLESSNGRGPDIGGDSRHGLSGGGRRGAATMGRWDHSQTVNFITEDWNLEPLLIEESGGCQYTNFTRDRKKSASAKTLQIKSGLAFKRLNKKHSIVSVTVKV